MQTLGFSAGQAHNERSGAARRGVKPRKQSETSTPDLPLRRQPEVEAQLYVGRDVCPRDGHRWTGDIRSKGARTQTTKGDGNPPRGRYFVPVSV